jgi:hypothetical protein
LHEYAEICDIPGVFAVFGVKIFIFVNIFIALCAKRGPRIFRRPVPATCGAGLAAAVRGSSRAGVYGVIAPRVIF